MFAKLKIVVLIIACATLINAQTVAEVKPSESEEKLRKDAVAFLRETLTDVNGMRSLENRISFTAELASLMWYHDEREARSMFIGTIGQFKDLIARYESKMNELGEPTEDEDPGTQTGPFIFDPSERTQVLRRFGVAMGVRQQLALSMAEHDPDLAFNFYTDSMSMLANPALRQEAETKGATFEAQLLAQLAEKDAGKAAKFAKNSLEKGFNFQHLDILRKIHTQSPDGGREFGLAILSSVKGGKTDSSGVYSISSLIDFGESTLTDSKTPSGKRAIFTEPELRELAEVIALRVLDQPTDDPSMAMAHIDTIQKYLPGRATQIRTKFKLGRTGKNSNSNTKVFHGSEEPFNDESAEIHTPIITSGSNANTSSKRREDREKAEKQLYEDIEGMATKQLPKEERSKIVEQARKILATTPGRDKKILGLSMLAAQVAKQGDKELATEIMRDAEKLVNPSPKNFQDFMLVWMLASGYAGADPDKAFPILEETIGRANELLSAVVKIGEFIDVNEDFIVEGEVQVGAFGGQMVRGMTKELNMADSLIHVLARADFDKTKTLTSRFDRTEIRVLAKMMVLRAVLSSKDATPTGDSIGAAQLEIAN